MKRRIKVIGYKNDVITLKVDGQLLSYLVGRAQPLCHADAVMLRRVMDASIIESMLAVPQNRILSWFHKLWGHKNGVSYSYETVADYIEKVGVEVDISKKAKALVILRSHVDNIRKGRV